MDGMSQTSFKYEPISPEELQTLFERCAQGDMKAREHIIISHLPLVTKICTRYDYPGVPFDDLFQEGCFGLLMAMGKLDPARSATFPALAKSYIEKYVKKALFTQNSFYPLVYQEDFFFEMQNYLKALDFLSLELGRNPSNAELAKELNVTEKKIRKLSHSLFLFIPIQELVSDNFIDDVPASMYYNAAPEDRILEKTLNLDSLNCCLHPREKMVLCRRLGFTDSGRPESLDDIAYSMGLSHESVRLAYNQAINKIRKAVSDLGLTVNTINL